MRTLAGDSYRFIPEAEVASDDPIVPPSVSAFGRSAYRSRSGRKTAVVQFTLPGDKTGPKDQPVESKPLTREDEYDVQLSIDGHVFPAGFFQSPRNDEQWRDFVKRLRDCNVNRNDDGYRGAVFIRSFGADLYQKLAGLSPKLREFLGETGTPRRLVIQTYRPELHLLPWSALYDEDGKYVADGDLSVVQAWMISR